ncbi:NB-ARC domain-containing protein [Cupriavidus basilensis]
MNEAAIEKDKIYALSRLRKIEYISNLRVEHPNLQDVGEQVVEFLHPFNDVSIISIVGVSGVGKTALVKELTPQLLETVDYEQPGGIYFVSAPSAVARKMEISSVYDGVLGGLDAMTDKKYAIEEEDDRIRQLRRQAKKVEWRKKEMLRLLPVAQSPCAGYRRSVSFAALWRSTRAAGHAEVNC